MKERGDGEGEKLIINLHKVRHFLYLIRSAECSERKVQTHNTTAVISHLKNKITHNHYSIIFDVKCLTDKLAVGYQVEVAADD